MSDIKYLSETLGKVENYIQESDLECKNAASKTSGFWREIFESRPNFPDINQLLTFRRLDYRYGIGDIKHRDLTEEALYFKRMLYFFNKIVPQEYYTHVNEPMFGAPNLFKIMDSYRSIGFVVNAGTANRIKHFVNRFLNKKSGLNVCEIGAGWGGCAYQLHKILDINSYTIIDLPENLYLSSIYLAMTLPVKRIKCVGSEEQGSENSINIALPNKLKEINGKFDLIINTFSLQEMDSDSVYEYIEWAKEKLSEDGIFISFNAHGKAGIHSLKEYGYEQFKLHHLGVFRKLPIGFFNTIPYEVVFGLKTPKTPEYDPIALNALGDLVQLGLDENLSPISRMILEGQSASANDFLRYIDSFFNESDDINKQAFLDLAKNSQFCDTMVHYLQGNFYFVQGRHPEALQEIELAIENGLLGFALFKAKIIRYFLLCHGSFPNRPDIKFLPEDQETISMYPELLNMIELKNPDSLIAKINILLKRKNVSVRKDIKHMGHKIYSKLLKTRKLLNTKSK